MAARKSIHRLAVLVLGLFAAVASAQPAHENWTWMGGINTLGCGAGQCALPGGVYGTLGTAAAGNLPGSRRSAASWTENSGHLWLFGGDGLDAGGSQGYLNDVWEFDTSSVEWIWMGGSNMNGPDLGQTGDRKSVV